MSDTLLLPPAERFARVIEAVFQALAAQGVRGTLVGPLLLLVCGRLRRAAARVVRLATALQAGTLRIRPARHRPPRRNPPATVPPKPRLPRSFGWLVRRVRAVAFGRSQLEHLLAQPDMAALIAAAPPVGHHIRPICRMLGVRPPPGLLPPRRRGPPDAAAERERIEPNAPRETAPAAGPASRPPRERPARTAASAPGTGPPDVRARPADAELRRVYSGIDISSNSETAATG